MEIRGQLRSDEDLFRIMFNVELDQRDNAQCAHVLTMRVLDL